MAESISTMSEAKKVAYFLILMGDEAAVKIFEHLPGKMIEAIMIESVQAKNIDKDLAIEILNEFYILVKSHKYISSGGYEYAKEILFKTMPPAEAQKILDKLSRLSKKVQAFSFIDKVDPKQLGEFLKYETAQTIAIVLSHMDPTSAAETLNTFPDSTKVQITLQMATIKDVSQDIINTISKVLEDKLDMFSSSVLELGGVMVAADMLNRVSTTTSKSILESLEVKNEKVQRAIKENMFTFDNLLELEDSAIQKILTSTETPTLTIALKNAGDFAMVKFTTNMSARAKLRFEEELELLGKVKQKDMDDAQRVILDITQEMLDNGTIEREDYS
jgi:flagellar motor switch protein FliG